MFARLAGDSITQRRGRFGKDGPNAWNTQETALAQPVASTSTLPVQVSSSASVSPAGSGTSTPTPTQIQYLTVQDELSLVTYYLSGISQICRGLKYPEMVEATAVTYLKRFYLRNTCMDYHPKNVMYAAVP